MELNFKIQRQNLYESLVKATHIYKRGCILDKGHRYCGILFDVKDGKINIVSTDSHRLTLSTHQFPGADKDAAAFVPLQQINDMMDWLKKVAKHEWLEIVFGARNIPGNDRLVDAIIFRRDIDKGAFSADGTDCPFASGSSTSWQSFFDRKFESHFFIATGFVQARIKELQELKKGQTKKTLPSDLIIKICGPIGEREIHLEPNHTDYPVWEYMPEVGSNLPHPKTIWMRIQYFVEQFKKGIFDKGIVKVSFGEEHDFITFSQDDFTLLVMLLGTGRVTETAKERAERIQKEKKDQDAKMASVMTEHGRQQKKATQERRKG